MLRRGTRTVRRNVSKEATGPSRITNSSSPSSILVPISCRTPLWRPRGGTVSLYPRWTSTVTGRMNKPSIRTAAGVIASVWAAFLLPPQLVVWSLSDTPEWMVRLASSTMYEWLTARGASVGLTDPYFLYGAAVAPSFLLIGWVLTHATRGLGWTGRALSWITLAGAPSSWSATPPKTGPTHGACCGEPRRSCSWPSAWRGSPPASSPSGATSLGRGPR